jgi:hypothetical protein
MESGEDGERRGRREAMTESDEKSNNFSTNLLLITNICHYYAQQDTIVNK